MNQLEKNSAFGQPKNALVSSDMPNDAYFAQQTVIGSLYVKKIFGPRTLKFIQKSAEYGEFEARYDHHLEPNRGGWVVVFRGNQEAMQKLQQGMTPQDSLEVWAADGHRFTQLGFDLKGRGEQIRISLAENQVHEDPSATELGSTRVRLELSRGGKPALTQVRISADHGEINALSYAMDGKSDAEVLAFAREQWQSQPKKLNGRSDAEIIKHAREAFVDGVYTADQSSLQALKQGEVIRETGLKLVGLRDYTLQPGADILLVGKAEAIHGSGPTPLVTLLREGGSDVVNGERTQITSEILTTRSLFVDLDGQPVTAEKPLELHGRYSMVTIKYLGTNEQGAFLWSKVSHTLDYLDEPMPNVTFGETVPDQFELHTEDGGVAIVINNIEGAEDSAADEVIEIDEEDYDLSVPVTLVNPGDVLLDPLPRSRVERALNGVMAEHGPASEPESVADLAMLASQQRALEHYLMTE